MFSLSYSPVLVCFSYLSRHALVCSILVMF
nr:MAG TPA: hypothetical protein [Caudoviricetes sp.]